MLVSIANRDGQQIVCAPRLARRPRPVVSIWMAMFSLCWTCCTVGSSMEVIKPKDGRCLLLRSCEISCQFGSRVDDLELQRLWARRRAVQLGKWSGLTKWGMDLLGEIPGLRQSSRSQGDSKNPVASTCFACYTPNVPTLHTYRVRFGCLLSPSTLPAYLCRANAKLSRRRRRHP